MTRLALGLLLTLAVSNGVVAQSAQELYQRGLVQEHGNGNLQQAIALYTCAGRSEMQTSPEFKVALGLRHELPLSNGGSLSTSVDYTHTDKMRSNVTVLDFVNLPSYDLLSARIQYSAPNERWNVAVFATNLTDEYYLATMGRPDMLADGGFETWGRSLLLCVTAKF